MTTISTPAVRDERKTAHLKLPHAHKLLGPLFRPSLTSVSKASERR